MDLPAKAAVLNSKQFNGKFGCTYCYHPGEAKFRKRIYPPNKFDLRSDCEYKKMSKLAEENNESIFGIKGRCSLSKIVKIPSQIPLDYMHLVLQGHTKWLIRQYFYSDKSNDYFLGYELENINSILKKQKVPHNLGRALKNIDESLKMKSNELKVFLFYQSIPLLFNKLPFLYFNMLASYVFAIRILYEPIQDLSEIENAKIILEKYVENLEDTFGDHAYDYTIHDLHLADQVKNHGPLHCHSQVHCTT